MNDIKSLNFWINSPPYSADPMEYDYSIHHSVYRSVISTLTSNYSTGDITGVLVKSWKNSGDYRKWTLEIRKNIKFENGDSITAEIISKSFKRAAIILKSNKSKEGFLDKLVGISKLVSIDTKIDGITISEDKITFEFQEPVPTFLNHLSFGLYGVVHPDNYDLTTGSWKASTNVISSGPYRIQSHDKNNLILVKNQNFDHTIGHPRKFEKINIFWDKSKQLNSDLYRGTSLDQEISSDFEYSGGLESGIAFIRCHSYKSKNSPCHNIETRQAMRAKLYNNLKENGFLPTTSFFPKGLSGLNEDKFEQIESKIDLDLNLKVRNFTNSNLLFHPLVNKILMKDFKADIQNEISLRDIMMEIQTNKDSYLVDLAGIVTGILVNEPHDDIIFMFKSSSGIQLPDVTGLILKELEKDKIDVNLINRELWDQAIIWPIAHFSNGLFYKKFIDLSYLNLVQPPIDFNWVGIK